MSRDWLHNDVVGLSIASRDDAKMPAASYEPQQSESSVSGQDWPLAWAWTLRSDSGSKESRRGVAAKSS